MGRNYVEGMATYRLIDAGDLDVVTNAIAMAEHRMRVAASISGRRVTGEVTTNTHTVGGVVLIRTRAAAEVVIGLPVVEG